MNVSQAKASGIKIVQSASTFASVMLGRGICPKEGTSLLRGQTVTLWKTCINTCRGPAPADPGYSKERWLGDLFKC